MITLVIILSAGAAVLSQYPYKKLLTKNEPAAVLGGLFLGCFILVGLYAAVARSFVFVLPVAFVGLINASLATPLFARAIKINLSATMLFLPLTNVMAIILSAIYLGEWTIIAPHATWGLVRLAAIVVSLLAVGLLGGRLERSGGRGRWRLALVGFIFLTGIVNFMIKYFAVSAIAPAAYIWSWYAGSFIGSLFLRLGKSIAPGPRLADWPLYALLSAGTVVAMGGTFYALARAPAALVLPMYSVLYALGAILLGMFIFKERRAFTRQDLAAFGLGLAGLIVLSFWF